MTAETQVFMALIGVCLSFLAVCVEKIFSTNRMMKMLEELQAHDHTCALSVQVLTASVKEQNDMMEALIKMHDDPESKFSTVKCKDQLTQVLSNQREMLTRLREGDRG